MLETLANIGEFVAALGVIGSLIFLAVETRKNTSTLRASLTSDALNQFAVVNDFAMTDKSLREVIDKSMTPDAVASDFSEAEWSQFVYFARATIMRIEGIHILYLQGLIEKELWEARMRLTAGLLITPVWKTYWETERNNSIYTTSFIDALESVEGIEFQLPTSAEGN